MLGRTEQHAHRHVRQKRLEPFLFLRKAGGFALHRLGQGRAGLGQMLGHRGRRGGQIAQIAATVTIEFGLDLGMGARAQAPGQPLDRLGDILVEEEPDRGDQPDDRKARDHTADDETVERIGGVQLFEPEDEARHQSHDIARGKRREEQEDAQTQAQPGEVHHRPPVSRSL